MLEYDRIDISEGIDNKIDSSCKRSTCHYWYFFMTNFRFQPKLRDSCHDMLQKL